jgi:hypothetical protein
MLGAAFHLFTFHQSPLTAARERPSPLTSRSRSNLNSCLAHISASASALALSGPRYPRNGIAFYFTGGSVSVSGANAPPMTGRALKLVDWLIVSYKSGNGVAEALEFA